jgi:hypothetical protein
MHDNGPDVVGAVAFASCAGTLRAGDRGGGAGARCRGSGAERAAEGEDKEPDPCQQEGDAHDDPEERQLLRLEAHVQRSGEGLIGRLELLAGFALLFTKRYPPALYDFVLGLNRWVFRVAASAGLMADTYPPFRLDNGSHEPPSARAAAIVPAAAP